MKAWNTQIGLMVACITVVLCAAAVGAAELDLSAFHFTPVKDLTLHYFGIGDAITLKSEQDLPGSLLIVGGGLKPDNAAVYERFIKLAGGAEQAKIAIMPTASANPMQSAGYMVEDFVSYGVPEENLMIVPVAVKDDEDTEDVDESTWSENGMSAEVAASLEGYTGVWFVGGWQDRITGALFAEDGSDGPVLEAIKNIYANGGVIGGSSAGAAIMSDPMINGGTSLGALTREVIHEDRGASDERLFMNRGIGFFPFGFVDQHSIARGRFGRLIAACLTQDVAMGFGIDENTAIALDGNVLNVIGDEASRSGVVVVDRADGIEAYTINAQRESTTGQEYYDGNQLNTNVFAPYALVDMIAEDLADNTANSVTGLSFTMVDDTNAIGVQVECSKTDKTEGFYGKIDGVYTYSVVNVKVNVTPITLRIEDVQ